MSLRPMTPAEQAVDDRNNRAIALAGSLAAAYGSDPSRIVPGRGTWAGKFWLLKGAICDGPFDSALQARDFGRIFERPVA